MFILPFSSGSARIAYFFACFSIFRSLSRMSGSVFDELYNFIQPAKSTCMSSSHLDQTIWNKNVFPQKINPEEDILFVTRQDVAILVFQALGLAAIFILILLARTVLRASLPDPVFLAFIDVAVYGGLLVMVTYFAVIFHNYYLSMQIVTSDRVIDIDQKGLFQREVNELAVDNIEDVTYKQTGFWSVILGFGDVIIKTASISDEPDSDVNGFIFENVPAPRDVAAKISNIYHQNQSDEKQESAQLNAEAIRKAFNPDLYK